MRLFSNMFLKTLGRSLALIAIFVLAFSASVQSPWVESFSSPVQVVRMGEMVSAADDGSQGNWVTTQAQMNASAAAKNTTPTKNQYMEGVVQFLNFAIETLYIFYIPLTTLAGWLLSPDWTFGQIFGMREVLHSLWIMIANLVYIFFAFALVAMAFINIFGKGGGDFAIKSAMPRFVVGILIVPFTWFIVSAVLSISNILTASVLRLPYEVLSDAKRSTYSFEVCSKYKLDFAQVDAKKEGKVFSACEDGDKKKVTLQEFFTSWNGAYNLLTVYASSIFRADELKTIGEMSRKSIGTIGDLGIQLIVGAIVFLMFGILMLALVFALLSRAAYLWIFAIFSPLFGLFHFLNGKAFSSAEKKFGFKAFISLAMVPVYVAGALSFGLLFLKLVENLPMDTQNSQFFSSMTAGEGENPATFQIGSKDGKAATTIEVAGAGTFMGLANDAKTLGGNAIGRLILSILGVVVLWMAVMLVLQHNDVTKAASQPFMNFGNEIGKLAAMIPSHAPIPWTGGLTLSGASKIPNSISGAIDTASASKASAVGRELGSAFNKAMGLPDVAELQDMAGKVASIQKVSGLSGDKQYIEEIAALGKSKQDFASDPVARQKILLPMIDKLEKLSAEDKTALKKEFESANSVMAMDNALVKLWDKLGASDFGQSLKTGKWDGLAATKEVKNKLEIIDTTNLKLSTDNTTQKFEFTTPAAWVEKFDITNGVIQLTFNDFLKKIGKENATDEAKKELKERLEQGGKKFK